MKQAILLFVMLPFLAAAQKPGKVSKMKDPEKIAAYITSLLKPAAGKEATKTEIDGRTCSYVVVSYEVSDGKIIHDYKSACEGVTDPPEQFRNTFTPQWQNVTDVTAVADMGEGWNKELGGVQITFAAKFKYTLETRFGAYEMEDDKISLIVPAAKAEQVKEAVDRLIAIAKKE